MTDLANFLRARIAERRATAEAAAAPQCDPEEGWGLIDPSNYAPTEKRRWIAPHVGLLYEAEFAEHVVANNPAVILADLDAKLALLEDVVADRHDANHEDAWYSCATITEGDGACLDDRRRGKPCDCGRDVRVNRRLRILARPFAEHPDYKGDWAP